MNLNTDDELEQDHGDDDQEAFDISDLPKARGWLRSGVCKYQGFWFSPAILPNILDFRRTFQARDGDIVVASKPKTGTTWLKAIVFSVVHRAQYTPANTPLLTSNPHALVPIVEIMKQDLSTLAPPRLLSTHAPFSFFPESVKRSKCRVLYVCRNPLDVIVSFWHFSKQAHPDRDAAWTLEDLVDAFCQGSDVYGPFWDHALGFWRESLERPDKVLFLMYEDMKRDPGLHVKKIAEFVGFPFSEAEEKGGIVEEICEMCSLRSLRDSQANNRPENCVPNFDNNFFYRKGEAGDWVNELSPSMVERVEKVVAEKMSGSGLTFNRAS